MRLVLFDFDGTLTRRDSLMPFLRQTVGTAAFVGGLARCSAMLAAYAAGRIRNDRAKERLLAHFFGGRSIDELHKAGQRFANGSLNGLLRPAQMALLEQHREAGDTCVLVSASLDLYLEPWARGHGFEAVLSSRLATDEHGRVSGRLEPANCHGPEKARRIQAWLADRRPSHVTAYGDSRGDVEMLKMADAPHWIGRRFE